MIERRMLFSFNVLKGKQLISSSFHSLFDAGNIVTLEWRIDCSPRRLTTRIESQREEEYPWRIMACRDFTAKRGKRRQEEEKSQRQNDWQWAWNERVKTKKSSKKESSLSSWQESFPFLFVSLLLIWWRKGKRDTNWLWSHWGNASVVHAARKRWRTMKKNEWKLEWTITKQRERERERERVKWVMNRRLVFFLVFLCFASKIHLHSL